MNIRTEFEEQMRLLKRSKRKHHTNWDFNTYLTNVRHLDFITRDDVPPNLSKDEKRLLNLRKYKDPGHELHGRYKKTVKRLKKRIKEYETSLCPCPLNKLSLKQKQQISDINDLIVGKTSYGREPVKNFNPRADSVIHWSNGFEGWIAMRNTRKLTHLDANEMVVKNIKMDELYPLLCCLENLPLYGTSYEAKQEMTPEEQIKATEDWISIMEASLRMDRINEQTK